jgi:hypothetical protein
MGWSPSGSLNCMACSRAYSPPLGQQLGVACPVRPRGHPSSTSMRSACSMVDRRWAMTSVVRPASAARARPARRVRSRLSSAEVASSRIRTGASLYIARAIARRWRWPPDSWLPLWPITVSRPCGRRRRSPAGWRAQRTARTRGLARCRPRCAQRHVGGDAVVEQHHVLADQRELPAQRRRMSQSAQGVAVEQHQARGGLDEARQQVDQRRLAGARGADQGHGLAGAHRAASGRRQGGRLASLR